MGLSPMVIVCERKKFVLKWVGPSERSLVSFEERSRGKSWRGFLSFQGAQWLGRTLSEFGSLEDNGSVNHYTDNLVTLVLTKRSNSHGSFGEVVITPFSSKGRRVVICVPKDREGLGWKSVGISLRNFASTLSISRSPPVSDPSPRNSIDSRSYRDVVLSKNDVPRIFETDKVELVASFHNSDSGWLSFLQVVNDKKWRDPLHFPTTIATDSVNVAIKVAPLMGQRCKLCGEDEAELAALTKVEPTNSFVTENCYKDSRDRIAATGAANSQNSQVRGATLNSNSNLQPEIQGQLDRSDSVEKATEGNVALPIIMSTSSRKKVVGLKEVSGQLPISSMLEPMDHALSPILDSLEQIIETSSLKSNGAGYSHANKRESRIFRRKIVRQELTKAGQIHSLVPGTREDPCPSLLPPDSIQSPVILNLDKGKGIEESSSTCERLSGNTHASPQLSPDSSSFVFIGKRRNFKNIVMSEPMEGSEIGHDDSREEVVESEKIEAINDLENWDTDSDASETDNLVEEELVEDSDEVIEVKETQWDELEEKEAWAKNRLKKFGVVIGLARPPPSIRPSHIVGKVTDESILQWCRLWLL